MQTYDFFTFFRRHANLWLFYIFQTTCKPMTFLHFSDDMQTYDFFTFFRRHANLWLFYIFQTTCKPMTFFRRHANLWLFYIFQTTCKPMTFLHFSDDMQTYDFFTFFGRHANLWLFIIGIIEPSLYKSCISFVDWLLMWQTLYANLWLFYIFQTTCKPMTFLHFSDDMKTYDFFTFFRRHANLWLFIIGIIEPSLYKSCISFVEWLLMWHWNFMQTYDFFTFFRRHANLWLFYIFQTTCKPMTFFYIFQTTCKPLTFHHRYNRTLTL